MNKTSLSLCAAISLLSASAEATILVSGDYLEITGRVSEPIIIADGSRVTVRGGEIIAPGQLRLNTGTVTLAPANDGQRLTFEMQGNSFLTSTNSVPLFFWYRSTVRLSDDSLIVARGDTAIGARGGNGENFLFLENRATVVGNIAVDANVFITDQARITGRLVEADGNVRLTMSGGSINGGVNLTSAGDYSADISGGRVDNGFRFGSTTAIFHFNMSGGEIYGGFTALGSIGDGNLFDGSIYGGMHLDPMAHMSVWGGNLNADEDGWLIETLVSAFSSAPRTVVSLYGGQIGQLEAGRGIRLAGFNGLDVYGYDLNLTNGLLSGYLSDGNWLSVNVLTESDWAGAINLHDVRKSVPEPSAAWLFLTAVTGMLGLRRRKLQL